MANLAQSADNLDALNGPRLITESGVEAKVVTAIEPIIRDLGYRLVRVRLLGQNGLTLQIMVERPDGTVDVNDCEKVSLEISPVLDIDDPIDRAYHLEVSSPGIDRPLVRRSDFDRWLGHISKLEANRLVDGRKRFKGVLMALEGDMLTLKREQKTPDDSETVTLDVTDLAEARLVVTDELIRDALKRDKALRAANGLEDETETDETGNDAPALN